MNSPPVVTRIASFSDLLSVRTIPREDDWVLTALITSFTLFFFFVRYALVPMVNAVVIGSSPLVRRKYSSLSADDK